MEKIMHRKSSRWLLAGVLIAAHAGGGCGGGGGLLISGGSGAITVAQLEDGRWARGYVSSFQPNSSWNLRLADGRYMNGDVISEEMAQNYLNPPPAVSDDDSDSDSGETSPLVRVVENRPNPKPRAEPQPGPAPETGCGIDYEC
jgi:hypothetical protein